MVEEPDNLVIKLLREIRDTQEKHDGRLEHIERDMKDLRGQFIYGLGAATAADLRSREVEDRIDDLDEKMKALEAALADNA